MSIPKPPVLDEVPLPDDPGLLRGWGRKLEVTLLRFALRVFNSVMSPFWKMRDDAAKWLFQEIEDELKPVINPLMDQIDGNANVPGWVRDMTKHLRFSEPITFAAIACAVIAAAIVGLAMGFIQPIIRLVAQETDSYVHSARMTPTEAFQALKRGAISPEDYHNHLSDGGWSEELEVAWKQLLAPLVGVGDLGQLYLRGELGEGDFDNQMGKRGYTIEEITRVKVLLQVIPPLPDIIRMAVREAFSSEAIQTFELHAELPGELTTWAKKQGLDEYWSRAYWASHWQLPSLTMGYEMLHREEIGETEMRMLIKAHDVSPFWREKLINISYNPFTRVDIRRMHAVGEATVEEVYRNYRDIGYNHERATKMTNFTVKLNQGAERDLSKTDILYGYETGYFKPEETDALLISLGYDQNEAEFYRAKVDFKRYQKVVKETVKYVGQQYIANQIEQAEVYTQLAVLALPAEQTNRYIREWDIKKKAKTKRLTADRLLKFLSGKIIKEDMFAKEMSGLGYADRYIQWYIDSTKGK